jgi:hypothetical protein
MQIKRAPDQTLIAFACHVELLRAVDIGRNEVGEDRSTFIRKAIFNELKARKQPVLDEWVSPPDRAKKLRYPEIPPVIPKAGSATPSAASTSGERAATVAPSPDPVSGRKHKAASPSGKTSGPASRARGR